MTPPNIETATDASQFVDETNIRIRPRKRKEMGLTYIISFDIGVT